MISTLMKLGLSEKEAKVYLAALELAKDTAQNIAKKAKVNRPTAYFILEKLMELGLISTLDEEKKTYFVAEDPKELKNVLEREKQELLEREQELSESMNQFSAVYNANLDKPRVRYFEGAEGLEAMDRYGRNLYKGKEVLGISPIDLLEKMFPERRKSSLGERVKLGIKARTIYTHNDGEITGFQNQKELRDGIFIPREKLPINAAMTVYPEWGVKLYYFDQSKPYGVVIEDVGIAKNMAIFFELCWTGAKQIEKK